MSTFRSLRIAIADDDARIRDFLERALILLGHQVVGVAANGDELVDLCLLTRPDLILTDVHMPGANGLEAIQRIWRTVMVPAIVLTGLPDHELLAGNNVRHSALCLMKPVPLAELGRAIATAASRGARDRTEGGKRRPTEPRRPDRRASVEIAVDQARDDARPATGERPRVSGRRESAGGAN